MFPKSIVRFQTRYELRKLIHAMYSVDLRRASAEAFQDSDKFIRTKLFNIARILTKDLSLTRSQAERICAEHYRYPSFCSNP